MGASNSSENAASSESRSAPEPNSAPRTLRVTLSRAVDLVVADFTSSDPYVEFSIESIKLVSSCVASSVNPEWGDEVLDFCLTKGDLSSGTLNIKVFDHDFGTSDDLIGTAVIELSQFEANKSRQAVHCPLAVPVRFSDQNVESFLHGYIEVLESWNDLPLTQPEHQEYSWTALDWISTSTLAPEQSNDPQWVALLHAPALVDVDRDGWLYSHSLNGPWFKTKHWRAVHRMRVWLYTPPPEPSPEPADSTEPAVPTTIAKSVGGMVGIAAKEGAIGGAITGVGIWIGTAGSATLPVVLGLPMAAGALPVALAAGAAVGGVFAVKFAISFAKQIVFPSIVDAAVSEADKVIDPHQTFAETIAENLVDVGELVLNII